MPHAAQIHSEMLLMLMLVRCMALYAMYPMNLARLNLNDMSRSQVRRLPNGNQEVGVHIADVTNFLAPGTPMDKEAAARCLDENFAATRRRLPQPDAPESRQRTAQGGRGTGRATCSRWLPACKPSNS